MKNWKDYNRKNLVDLSAQPDKLVEAEGEIHKRLSSEIRGRCNVGEVLLSVPAVPKIKSDFAFIQTSPTAPVESIEEFFPLEQWTEAYAHNKWRSFAYAPREFAKPVRDAAVSLMQEAMGIKIDVDKSNQMCHLT